MTNIRKMEPLRCVLLCGFVLGLTGAMLFAADSDFDIHVFPRKADAAQSQNRDIRAISKECWNYEVTIENRTFQSLAMIEVRYMTFYTTEKLGSKAPAQQRHESGTFSIDVLKPHEKISFTTNAVELNKSHLTGHWYYSGGEHIKAEDTLTGVWVRLYRGGQQVAEYANPSILSKEQWQ